MLKEKKFEMKKRNQIFNYLYVMAILMVIDDHTSTKIDFLSNIFPYNSFYMPLFVFCSGYFYKKSSCKENILHKTKRILIPYFIWNIIALVISYLLDVLIGVNWSCKLNISSIIYWLIQGPTTSLNGATWFAIMLFWVSILYNIIRNFLENNKYNDIVLTIVFCIVGFVSTYLATKGFNRIDLSWIFILKIFFYIQFYHYGYMFNLYLEKKILKFNKVLICLICVLINIFLIRICDAEINFYETAYMDKFKSWYLPLITSCTGIIFWYEIMEYLSRKIGENSITNFISRNTFVIMEVHLFFLNIPKIFIYRKIMNGSTQYADFDVSAFINSAWYRYSTNARLLEFFLGVFGSLFIAYLIEKVKHKIINS